MQVVIDPFLPWALLGALVTIAAQLGMALRRAKKINHSLTTIARETIRGDAKEAATQMSKLANFLADPHDARSRFVFDRILQERERRRAERTRCPEPEM